MDGYECRACGSTAALFKEIRAVRFARSARWVEGRIEVELLEHNDLDDPINAFAWFCGNCNPEGRCLDDVVRRIEA